MGMTNAVPGEYIVLPTPPLATVDFWADMASRISMLDLRHFEAQLERYWAFGSLGHVRGAIVERHEQLVQMKDLSTCISYSLGGSYLATASERADGVPIVTLWTVGLAVGPSRRSRRGTFGSNLIACSGYNDFTKGPASRFALLGMKLYREDEDPSPDGSG
jgi:hypothetical protein